MTAQNIFTRALESIRHLFKNGLWGFSPEHDDYPETGTRPLKHEVYKEKKDKSKLFH